jgi:hypothetical protein
MAGVGYNDNSYLRKIPFDDLLDTQYHNLATEITDLNYQDVAVKSNEYKVKEENTNPVVFFDFEAVPDAKKNTKRFKTRYT